MNELLRAIDFAIEQGLEAAVFLRCWREGDTSEWPEFPPPQPAQQPLSEEQIEAIFDPRNGAMQGLGEVARRFARAIEAAHGIAAAPQPAANQVDDIDVVDLARKPLSEADYLAALGTLRNEITCSAGTLRRIVRAVEAAHRVEGEK